MSQGEQDLIHRVFNENSFTALGNATYNIGTGVSNRPPVTWETLASENLAVASAVVNRARLTHVSLSYASTTQAAGVGYPLYSPNATARWTALSQSSLDPSPDCQNLKEITAAVASVLTNGPVYNFLSWRGLYNVTDYNLRPGQIVINDTVFSPWLQ